MLPAADTPFYRSQITPNLRPGAGGGMGVGVPGMAEMLRGRAVPPAGAPRVILGSSPGGFGEEGVGDLGWFFGGVLI